MACLKDTRYVAQYCALFITNISILFKKVKYGIFGARFTLQQVIILEFHNGYQVFLAKSQVRALRGQIFKAQRFAMFIYLYVLNTIART